MSAQFAIGYRICLPSFFEIASASSGVLATSPLGTPIPYYCVLERIGVSAGFRTDFSKLADKYSCIERFRVCWRELRTAESYECLISISLPCSFKCQFTLTALKVLPNALDLPSLSMMPVEVEVKVSVNLRRNRVTTSTDAVAGNVDGLASRTAAGPLSPNSWQSTVVGVKTACSP